MVSRLAIDPGDVHVGWAMQNPEGDVWTGEWTPVEAVVRVRDWCAEGFDGDRELIIESFVLYPGVNQSYSPMETSQLIGKLKLVAEDAGVPWTEQGAHIKIPTRRQLKARKIKTVAKGGHAADAELHLYYRKLREEVESI